MGVICRDEERTSKDDVKDFARGAIVNKSRVFKQGKYKGIESVQKAMAFLNDAEIVTTIPIVTSRFTTWIVRMYRGDTCMELRIKKRDYSNGVGAPCSPTS